MRTACGRWIWIAWSCVAACGVVACGELSSSGDSTLTDAGAGGACGVLASARRECGLDSLPCNSEADECVANCLRGSDCDTLEHLAVDLSTSLCTLGCDGLICDGDRKIPRWWRCDHEADCVDGSDESDCDR